MARSSREAKGPSRTAVFVCQGRAAADGRIGVGRFHDPIALRLLRDDERLLVERARSGEQPAQWHERMNVESVRACAEIVAPRTVAIDNAIERAAHRQVVILGAGLDTRPWRLAALRDAVVFAVDHPASQDDARDRAAGLEPLAAQLELVPADLTVDSLGEALARSGHDVGIATTWVWEGVVPYLTATAVATTIQSVAAASAPGSMFIVQYQSRSWVAAGGRLLSGWLSRRASNATITGDEPWRSLWSPASMADLLEDHGFTVLADDALLVLARAWQMPTTHGRSLANGRVLIAERAA